MLDYYTIYTTNDRSINGTAYGDTCQRAFPLSNQVNKHSLFDCDIDHLSAYKVLCDRPFRGRVLANQNMYTTITDMRQEEMYLNITTLSLRSHSKSAKIYGYVFLRIQK